MMTPNLSLGGVLLAAALSACCATDDTRYNVTVKNGIATARMVEYPDAFRNPMKGLREFFSPGVDKRRAEYPYPYGSMIKEYMQWNMIEDKASDDADKIRAYSDYRWEGVEDINMKVIPRVYLVWVEPWHGGKPKNPNNPDDMNGWHWASDMQPEFDSPYKQIPGSVGAMVEPQDSLKPISGGYFAPDFAARVEALVAKMGEAWDNDPRVAYIDMGIVGEWGEHHDPDLSTYWPPHDEPRHVANRTWVPGLEKVLGDAFTKAFKNKKVMVRYAYEFSDYEFGIYWDSWAQPEEIVRGYEEMLKLGDRWKTQPISGEITWNWGSLARHNSFESVVADDTTRRYTIEQIRNLHCNHLGGITWADFNDPQFQKNAAELQKALGYRFVLSKCTYPVNVAPGDAMDVSFTVTNTGSSPFYYDWPVEVALLDPQTHTKVWSTPLEGARISQWMPGEQWSKTEECYLSPAAPTIVKSRPVLDASVPKGEYILALSIVDPAGGLPSVRFANTNYFNGGYHPMGRIGVGMTPSTCELPTTSFDDIQQDKSLKYKID